MINTTTHKPIFEQFNFTSQKSADKKEKNNINIKAMIGTAVGTAIPIAMMLKKQNIKNPLKIEYGLKDILVLSGSSITGGTIGGMISEKKEVRKKKVKEGFFQLLNATLPILCVSAGIKFCEKYKRLNGIPCKAAAVAGGIASGMYGALKLTNKIFNSNSNQKRKLTPKDFLTSADDALGTLALANFPIINNLKIDKALPLIYGYCGYRAGKAE